MNKILVKFLTKNSKENKLEKHFLNLIPNENLELCMMAYKIQNGFNNNEVKLIPKKHYNKGFFEKFFQLFS